MPPTDWWTGATTPSAPTAWDSCPPACTGFQSVWDPGRAYITDSRSEAPTAIHTAVMNMNPCITIPGDAADSQPILRLGSSANHSFESCTVNETIHGGLGIDSVCYSAIRSDFHF